MNEVELDALMPEIDRLSVNVWEALSSGGTWEFHVMLFGGLLDFSGGFRFANVILLPYAAV